MVRKTFLVWLAYDHYFLSFVTHTKAYDIYFSCFAFCTIPENGTICESLDSTEKPAGDLKIEADGEVYLCRTNGTEPICSVLHHDQCITSGFYPCQYHWISAQSFANDPANFAAPSTDAAQKKKLPNPRTLHLLLALFLSHLEDRCHVVGSIMKDIREVCGAPICIFIWGLPCLIFERQRPKKENNAINVFLAVLLTSQIVCCCHQIIPNKRNITKI